MIDMKFLREHPDLVKENIKKKFQDHKLCLVDEVILLDETNRATKLKGDELRANRNRLSAEIGGLMREAVPIGEDDSKNVEVQKYGEPVVPDYEIPYHTDIMEKLSGIDLDAARRVAGNGFYYLIR